MAANTHQVTQEPVAGHLDADLRFVAASAVAVLVFTSLTPSSAGYLSTVVAMLLTTAQLRHGHRPTSATDPAIARGPLWTTLGIFSVILLVATFIPDDPMGTLRWLVSTLVSILIGIGSFLVVRWNMRARMRG